MGKRPRERLNLLDAVVDQRAAMGPAALVGGVRRVRREVERRLACAVVEDRRDQLTVLVDGARRHPGGTDARQQFLDLAGRDLRGGAITERGHDVPGEAQMLPLL